MININVRDNAAEVVKGLGALAQNQLPFATAVAITQTAKDVEKGLQTEIKTVFDNPSPYISRGTFSTSATKAKPEATIGMKDFGNARGASPARYVQESFGGGARGQKPFEIVLRSLGVLQAGWKAMPGEGMKLDRYGAPDRKVLAEIIGALKSGFSAYKGRGKRLAAVGYFAVPVGATRPQVQHLPPGIYRRIKSDSASAIQPVFIFVQAAQYQTRIDLKKIAQEVVRQKFEERFKAALERALRTAR